LFPSQISYYKIWVLKIISYGDIIWTKTYGRNNSQGTTVVSTNDGGYILSGNSGEAFTIKIDRDGNTLWEKYYGVFGIQIKKITKTTEDGFIMCGLENLQNGFILKIDSNGNFVWNKIHKSNDLKIYFDIITDFDKGYLVCGFEVKSQQDTAKAVVFKINDLGNIIWEKTIFYDDQIAAYSIKKSHDNFIIAGSIGTIPITTGRVFL